MSTDFIDEKDVDRFIRLMAQKATQIVVQSRLGNKMRTPSNPIAVTKDHFNIVIEDHPQVAEDTLKVIGSSGSILPSLPLCIEISLQTVEDDRMVLENWTLDCQVPGSQKTNKDKNGKIDSSPSDLQTLKQRHVIYNSMSMMLKSLITLSRAIPAYKLSRQQSPDSYKIFYRIFKGEPDLKHLGEGHKNIKVGQLNTIIGLLSMCVAYRTKMTISPTTGLRRNGDSNTMMLKSDHFRPSDTNGSPTQAPLLAALQRRNGCNGTNVERKAIDLEKPLRPGAFTDVSKLKKYTEDDFKLPETPPFDWLLSRTRHESGGSGGSIESLHRKSEGASSPVSNGQCTQNNNNAINHNNNPNLPSSNNNNNKTNFKSFEKDESSRKCLVPSPNASAATTNLSQSPIKSLLIPTPAISATVPIPVSRPPSDDEYLLKELNFPFAVSSRPNDDLAKFFRDCCHAPPLRSLNETETTSCSSAAGAATSIGSDSDLSAVDDLSRQLEHFETSLQDYDKLVSQLGLSTSSSTGSRSSGGLQMSN